jgi:hypothetical protein
MCEMLDARRILSGDLAIAKRLVPLFACLAVIRPGLDLLSASTAYEMHDVGAERPAMILDGVCCFNGKTWLSYSTYDTEDQGDATCQPIAGQQARE